MHARGVPLLAIAALASAAFGCGALDVFGGKVDDSITPEEQEWYEERLELEGRIEELEEELERANLRLDAARDELYPRFIAAMRPYFKEDWAGAVDAFAQLLIDYPDSELTEQARLLLDDARERQAMSDLLCSEDWRLFPSRLEALEELERTGVAAAFVKQCPEYEERVSRLLDQMRRNDAIRSRYTGEGEAERTIRGETVGLEEDAEGDSTSGDALGVEKGEEIELDPVTSR